MFQDSFFDEGYDDLKELIRQFEDMRKGHPHSFLDEDSFELIIDYYDGHEDLTNALQAADFGIAQFPYCSQLLIRKADLLIAAGRYTQSLELLEKAAALNPGDFNLYILMADAYLGLKQPDMATKLVNENIDRFSGEDRSELLLELADVYDDWEEFDKLFDCLKMVLEEDPENEEALHKICFWAEYTGRIEESIRLHQQILDDHPYNELAWFNLGSAYQEIRLYEKAIDAYKYVLAINEQFEYAYRNMADAYIRLRKYSKAIETLQHHLEVAKPDDVVYEAIGYCFEKKKKYEQSRYYYRKAYHLNPGDDHLYFRVGRTYMQEKNWSKAVRYLSTAQKLNIRSTEYCLALSECFLQMGDHEKAVSQLLEAIRLRPSSARCRLCLIRSLFIAGYLEEALSQLEKAEKETRPKPDYLYYRSAILLALGRSKEGLLQLEDALFQAPRKLKVLLSLNPSVLQHSGVVDLLIRFRRKKS